jgi:pyrroline-5-carboxylate reductase
MDLQTNQTAYRLGFIGAGKLGASVIRGLIRARFCSPGEIMASEPNAEVRVALEDETGISTTTDNMKVATSSETILVAVKPGVVLPAIREIASALKNKLVISLAAGTRLATMEKAAGARFMRVMTNTPSAIGRAATGLAAGARTTADDIARARNIFSAIGIVVEVREEDIDVVTALAGSGPAFVYSVIEALAKGATNAGLADDVALALSTQTVLGAAELAKSSKHSPEELRAMVVTPGGTTAAGLAKMQEYRVNEALAAAVEAAAKRGREMAKEYEQ